MVLSKSGNILKLKESYFSRLNFEFPSESKLAFLSNIAKYYKKKYNNYLIIDLADSCELAKLVTNSNYEENISFFYINRLDYQESIKVIESINIENLAIIVLSSENAQYFECELINLIQAEFIKQNIPVDFFHERILFFSQEDEIPDQRFTVNARTIKNEIYKISFVTITSDIVIFLSFLTNFRIRNFFDILHSYIKNIENHLGDYYQESLLLTDSSKNNIVLFLYSDSLQFLGEWYKNQLVKINKNSIISFGTIDQHSQLQLYLNGPNDKIYNIISIEEHESEIIVGPSEMNRAPIRISEILNNFASEVAASLRVNGRLTRVISIKKLNEENIARLLFKLSIELLIAEFFVNDQYINDRKQERMVV